MIFRAEGFNERGSRVTRLPNEPLVRWQFVNQFTAAEENQGTLNKFAAHIGFCDPIRRRGMHAGRPAEIAGMHEDMVKHDEVVERQGARKGLGKKDHKPDTRFKWRIEWAGGAAHSSIQSKLRSLTS